MMSIMILCLARDRTQPALLRWIAIGFLAEYMFASIVQSAIEHVSGAAAGSVLADRHAWYLLQGALFQIAFFACLLFMVSARLSAHLRRSEEHTSELQSLMRISYAVFCLKKKNNYTEIN